MESSISSRNLFLPSFLWATEMTSIWTSHISEKVNQSFSSEQMRLFNTNPIGKERFRKKIYRHSLWAALNAWRSTIDRCLPSSFSKSYNQRIRVQLNKLMIIWRLSECGLKGAGFGHVDDVHMRYIWMNRFQLQDHLQPWIPEIDKW
jgi:hypothetical protein